MAHDHSRPEAFSGLGWSQLGLEDLDIDSADYLEAIAGNFRSALSNSPQWYPAQAGLALTLSRQGASLPAVHFSTLALELVGDQWRFRHDARVDSRALYKVRAWNNFLLGQYPEAAADVERVLHVTLDPESADFLTELLARIEEL